MVRAVRGFPCAILAPFVVCLFRTVAELTMILGASTFAVHTSGKLESESVQRAEMIRSDMIG